MRKGESAGVSLQEIGVGFFGERYRPALKCRNGILDVESWGRVLFTWKNQASRAAYVSEHRLCARAGDRYYMQRHSGTSGQRCCNTLSFNEYCNVNS